MGQTNYWKIFAFFAFVVFAFISCFATVESLYLTLEDTDWPKWVFWPVVIGLFWLTSYCSKLIIDSLNQKTYLENRGVRLTFGVLGVLVLWLCFSMPTNSHTFFYKKMAKNVASAELTELSREIEASIDPEVVRKKYDAEWAIFEQNVRTAFNLFVQEVNDPLNPGYAERAEEALCKVEDALQVARGKTLQRSIRQAQNQTERTNLINNYADIVTKQLEVQKVVHDGKLSAELRNLTEKSSKKKDILDNINITIMELDNDNIEKEPTLSKARKLIQSGYNIMGMEGNLKVYSSERLTNVTKVWGDYLGGEFSDKNYGLIYWILLSVLVDIAAFVFFNIFRK